MATAAKSAHSEFLEAQFACLPKLAAFTKLGPRVWRVLGGNPSLFHLQGTNTYLVGTGAARILIDTAEGHPDWIRTLTTTLANEKITIKTALITHWHNDHVGGIPDLLKLSPETTVWKHNPTPGTQQQPIHDGQRFEVEGATLRAVFTPGHTDDHMCFVLEEERSIFAGDNVLGHGTTVFEDLGKYMNSLDVMLKLVESGPKKMLYPGHGEYVTDAAGKINEYIMHRKRREKQILVALREAKAEGRGRLTSLDIVKQIYGDADEGLWSAAEGGTVQVLEKLERDGLVGWEEGPVDGDRRKLWYLA